MKRINLLYLKARDKLTSLFKAKPNKDDGSTWSKVSSKIDEFVQKNKLWLIAMSFFTGIILSHLSLSGAYKESRQSYQNTISALSDSINVIRLDKDRTISQKNALELSIADLKKIQSDKDSDIHHLQQTIDKLKKANQNPVIVVETVIDNSSGIPNQGVISCDRDTIVNFLDDTLNANLNIVSDTNGIKINNLDYHITIPLSVSISKDRKVSVITNNNTTVTNLTSWIDPSLTSKPKKKWFSVGAQAGYGLTMNGPSPYIGLGVSINLLDF